MFKKFASLALLATATLSALPILPASAEVFRDGMDIYITELSPDAPVEVQYPNFQRSRDVRADACGRVVLRNSSTSPIGSTVTVGGTAMDTSSLPIQLLPKCNNGIPEEARAANFKTSTGDVVIVGHTANSYTTISTPTTATRRARANACGFTRLTSSNTYQHDPTMQIQIGSGSTAIGSLNQKGAPVCRSGVMYVPTSWLPN
jgi:hypothetical protein